jgi:hypothetical protein
MPLRGTDQTKESRTNACSALGFAQDATGLADMTAGRQSQHPEFVRDVNCTCISECASQHDKRIGTCKEKAHFASKVGFKWGDQWGSNPRQPESQSGALPTEL